MEESDYHLKADPALQQLVDFAEKLEENSDSEAEYDSGVLTITMPNNRQYVINKHTPSRQIWVSSPYSGAAYFEYRNGAWLAKRAVGATQETNLFDFITVEINSHID